MDNAGLAATLAATSDEVEVAVEVPWHRDGNTIAQLAAFHGVPDGWPATHNGRMAGRACRVAAGDRVIFWPTPGLEAAREYPLGVPRAVLCSGFMVAAAVIVGRLVMYAATGN